jgi:ribose 5-phosphate isomerase A
MHRPQQEKQSLGPRCAGWTAPLTPQDASRAIVLARDGMRYFDHALLELDPPDRGHPRGSALRPGRRSRKEERMDPTSLPGPRPEDMARAAQAALAHVADGMTLGLGTGRAAEAFIHALGERVRRGLRVRGVPTSNRSADLAQKLGIEVLTLEEIDHLDVAFDGADEVTPALELTKGLGGALLRERVVAYEADRFVVLVTPEKVVDKLGTRTPIPIEVVPFAVSTVKRHLKELGGEPALRARDGGFPYVTDNQNWILDTRFAPIDDPQRLGAGVRAIPGVVDHGIFLDMADLVLIGDEGVTRELRRG